MSSAEIHWMDAENDYKVGLLNNKLVCMNAKGKQLASVPKKVKEGSVAEKLISLRDWLIDHDKECLETVETWLLRSLPVPRSVLTSVWDDPAWRTPLENTVVAPIDKAGKLDSEGLGFLRGADPKKGVGVVDIDGETQWHKTDRILILHPILIPDLADWRELIGELSVAQHISQLFREIFEKPADLNKEKTSLDTFSDGKFEALNHVLGKCRTLGYRVRGGYAVCPVWENGQVIEARYWIGSESPEYETWTGELLWVDDKERSLKMEDVGVVAFSEGMRMASSLYAARVVKKEGDDQ